MFSNAVSLYFLQVSNLLVSLLLLPYLTRVLGPDAYGVVVYANILVGVLSILSAYSFSLSVTRLVTENRMGRDKLSKILFSVSLYQFVVFFIAVLLLAFFPVLELQRDTSAYYFLILRCLAFAAEGLFPLYLFQGLEKFKVVSVVSVISRLLLVFFVVAFVNSEQDLIVYGMLMVFVQVINLAAAYVIIYQSFSIFPKYESLFGEFGVCTLLKAGFRIFIGNVLAMSHTRISPLVFAQQVSVSVVGEFGVAYRMISIANQFTVPIIQVLYPRLLVLKESSVDLYHRYLLVALCSVGGVVGAGVILIVLYSDHIVRIVAGDGFGGVSEFLKIMAPVIFFVACGRILSQRYLVINRKETLRIWIFGLASLGSVLFTCVLPNQFGALGMSWIVVGVEAGAFFASLFFFLRYYLGFSERYSFPLGR